MGDSLGKTSMLDDDVRHDTLAARNDLAPFVLAERAHCMKSEGCLGEGWRRYVISRMSGYGSIVLLREAMQFAERQTTLPPSIKAAANDAIRALVELTQLVEAETRPGDAQDDDD